MRWTWKALLAVAAVLGTAIPAPQPATATTTTASVTVSASVSTACGSLAAATLALGTYSGSSLTTGTATEVSWQCSGGAPLTISFASTHTAVVGGVTVRQLAPTTGTGALTYALCEDNACATVIANNTNLNINNATTPNITCATNTATPPVTSCPLFANVASGQNQPSGSYSDSVTMTLTF